MVRESGLTLEAAAPYVKHFRGRIFVVKLSGEVLDEAAALDDVAYQLAVLDSLGIRLVVVHGGGTQANRLGERLGVPQRKVAGRRITDDATLEVVTLAFSGVRTALLAALRRHGVSALGLSGLDAHLTDAIRRPPVVVREPGQAPATVDFGHVADIESVHPEVLSDLMKSGHVPVVSSLAGDDQGRVFNINADTLSARLAAAIGAAKLVFLTAVPGLLRDVNDASSVVSYIDLAECDQLIETGAASGGMLPKLAACREALEHGVERTHLVSGTRPHALLREIFTNEGCGTLIVREAQAGAESGEPVGSA